MMRIHVFDHGQQERMLEKCATALYNLAQICEDAPWRDNVLELVNEADAALRGENRG